MCNSFCSDALFETVLPYELRTLIGNIIREFNFGSSALSQHLSCDPVDFEQGPASNPFLLHNICVDKIIRRVFGRAGITRDFNCGCFSCEVGRMNSRQRVIGLAATTISSTNEQQNVEINK